MATSAFVASSRNEMSVIRMACGERKKSSCLFPGNEGTAPSAHIQDILSISEERTVWMQAVVVGHRETDTRRGSIFTREGPGLETLFEKYLLAMHNV